MRHNNVKLQNEAYNDSIQFKALQTEFSHNWTIRIKSQVIQNNSFSKNVLYKHSLVIVIIQAVLIFSG